VSFRLNLALIEQFIPTGSNDLNIKTFFLVFQATQWASSKEKPSFDALAKKVKEK
tara:strand:- start:617 stop:781 length:165 start_codon:yes stop_codon:yes gene_type:complete